MEPLGGFVGKGPTSTTEPTPDGPPRPKELMYLLAGAAGLFLGPALLSLALKNSWGILCNLGEVICLEAWAHLQRDLSRDLYHCIECEDVGHHAWWEEEAAQMMAGATRDPETGFWSWPWPIDAPLTPGPSPT